MEIFFNPFNDYKILAIFFLLVWLFGLIYIYKFWN